MSLRFEGIATTTFCVLEALWRALRRRDVYAQGVDRWGDPRARLLDDAVPTLLMITNPFPPRAPVAATTGPATADTEGNDFVGSDVAVVAWGF